MAQIKFKRASQTNAHYDYSIFKKINGEHPLRETNCDCFVDYRARLRKGAKVSAFNFGLAREMGLLSDDHPNELNAELEKALIETFSLVIINEYDILNNVHIPEDEILPGKFMATKYLQLQHPNKQGKTSGDGRSIWNGHFKNRKLTWDVSSRGTGATRLSPATSIHNKFWQTGDPSISYGCGYCDLDEGISTLFFSEVLHKNGLPTERVLLVLEFPKKLSIVVRAHPNLIRPSHLFNHLKQGNQSSLKAMVDYYIDRQIVNKVWKDCPKGKRKYQYFLNKQTEVFATMAANFEDEYIFCWLDWDGDNVLMDGGIIDYGSVRQFGMFHAEYRYDDVQRYSTTIVEQKHKAKYIVQTFAQIVDFICTGKKKNIKHFANHRCLSYFDQVFQSVKDRNLVEKMGFKPDQVDFLMKNKRQLIKNFRHTFTYFERARSQRETYQVADGITRDALFCMRDILRELPQMYLLREKILERDEFIEIMKSSYCKKEDLTPNHYRDKMVDLFQKQYLGIVQAIARKTKKPKFEIVLDMTMRSSVINKYDRVTGDSITLITDRIMKDIKKLDHDEIYRILMDFIEYQNHNPDTKVHMDEYHVKKSPIIRSMISIVRENREGL